MYADRSRVCAACTLLFLLAGVLASCSPVARRVNPGVGSRTATTVPVASAASVTASGVVGTWSQPTPPELEIPSEQVLIFRTDGSGSTFNHLKFNGPGMGKPHPFKYSVRDGRVQLLYADGGSDTLAASLVDSMTFDSTLVGKSTHVHGGIWTRGSYQPSVK